MRSLTIFEIAAVLLLSLGISHSAMALDYTGLGAAADSADDPCTSIKADDKCSGACKDFAEAVKKPELQEHIQQFHQLLVNNQIKDGDKQYKFCSTPFTVKDVVKVIVTMGVAIAKEESSCDKENPGPKDSQGNPEHPRGYCQLNQKSTKTAYQGCSGADNSNLQKDGLIEAECCLGVNLQNIDKDKIWAEGETIKGTADAKGITAYQEVCANSKPDMKKRISEAIEQACNGGQVTIGDGKATAKQ